jgi:hypothetical protein
MLWVVSSDEEDVSMWRPDSMTVLGKRPRGVPGHEADDQLASAKAALTAEADT